LPDRRRTTQCSELKRRGVKVEDYDKPGMTTENGIAAAGDAKATWFKDTEGNTMALIEASAT
jgi:hypothetical protein